MTHPYDGLTPDRVISCVESIGLRSDLRLLALSACRSYETIGVVLPTICSI